MTPVEVFYVQRHPLGLSLGTVDFPSTNNNRTSLDRSRNVENPKEEQKTEKQEDKNGLTKRRKLSFTEEGSKLSLEIVSSESDMTVEEEEEEEEEPICEIRNNNHRLEDVECSLTLNRLKGAAATADSDYSVSRDFLMVHQDNQLPSDHNHNPLMDGESEAWLQLGLSSSSHLVHKKERNIAKLSSIESRDEGKQNDRQSTTLELLSRNSDINCSSCMASEPVDRPQAGFKRPAILSLLDNRGLKLATKLSCPDQRCELPSHDWQDGIFGNFRTNLQFHNAMQPQPDEGIPPATSRSGILHGVEEFPFLASAPGSSTAWLSHHQSWSHDGKQSLLPLHQYRHWNMASPRFQRPPLFGSLLNDHSSLNSSLNALQATTKPSSSFLSPTPSQQPLLFAEERSPDPSVALNPQPSNNSSTSSLCERLKVVKGAQCQTGIWFALEPAENLDKEGCILPQIQKNYLHVKDGEVKVSVVKKYVAAKLGLDADSQEEVEMRCRGQVIGTEPDMTLHHLRDNLWFSPQTLHAVQPAAMSSGKHQIMVLTYNRSKRPPGSSSSSSSSLMPAK